MQYSGLISNIQNETDVAFGILERVTKNLVNANTPGYKTERSETFDRVMRTAQRDMEPSKLEVTRSPSDITLEGKGFFMLQDEEGHYVFTRNLHLTTDKDRNLRSDDYLVLPKNQKLPDGIQSFTVSKNGELLGIDPSTKTKIPLTQLRVVNFPAAQELDFDGVVYRPTRKAGRMLDVSLGPTEQTQVRQYAQEGSNASIPFETNKFSQANLKVNTLSRLLQLLGNSEKQYINTLTQAIG
ncbi:MAG: hypothetical protein SFT81_03785 [Candidatus Caenarcaniphilales bacterium]|nr:hypothetical protein [Candidatus Caenarcaniphilales bacterium]